MSKQQKGAGVRRKWEYASIALNKVETQSSFWHFRAMLIKSTPAGAQALQVDETTNPGHGIRSKL